MCCFSYCSKDTGKCKFNLILIYLNISEQATLNDKKYEA
jgi:hypothetical protein